jgi:hypothetical protein
MLGKDGDHLDRSCEKWRNITKGQGGEEYPKTIRRKNANAIVHIFVGIAFWNTLLKER